MPGLFRPWKCSDTAIAESTHDHHMYVIEFSAERLGLAAEKRA